MRKLPLPPLHPKVKKLGYQALAVVFAAALAGLAAAGGYMLISPFFKSY